MATAARLARSAEFGAGDRADLVERAAQVRSVAHDLSLRLTPGDPSLRASSLALAAGVRAAAASAERRAWRGTGPAWERRIPGPLCPPACKAASLFQTWRPAGEMTTPGVAPDCLCRMEYFAGAEPPPPPSELSLATFRAWTIDEFSRLSPSQLCDLSPFDAGDAVAQLGDRISDDVRGLLESLAHGLPSRAAPPNPVGGHFGRDDTERFAHLARLVAVADLSAADLAGAAAKLVAAARASGSDSRAVYSSGRSYRPERAALHDQLLAHVAGVPMAEGTPIALVVIGPPASGKSRTAAEMTAAFGGEWVRADAMEFAARLPEYQGWNRDLLSREGGDVARRAVLAAADGFRNVVVECHDREPECPGRIAHFLAGLDYDVHGVCLTCPADVARSRAAARFSANPFGVCDPTADPAPFTPEDAGGHTARALAGYAGLSSWTVVEGL
jgi:predicted kinase